MSSKKIEGGGFHNCQILSIRSLYKFTFLHHCRIAYTLQMTQTSNEIELCCLTRNCLAPVFLFYFVDASIYLAWMWTTMHSSCWQCCQNKIGRTNQFLALDVHMSLRKLVIFLLFIFKIRSVQPFMFYVSKNWQKEKIV